MFALRSLGEALTLLLFFAALYAATIFVYCLGL